MTQSHLCLSFPLKSAADAKGVALELPPSMTDLFRAEDAIGTVHYSRFTVLSDRTLLFLADFDGDLEPLMLDLAKRSGPVFDLIFKHVNDAPPGAVANNADAFVEWVAEHLLNPAYVYSAYPGRTVKEIKTMAAAASVKGATKLLPFLVILPAKGRLAFAEMQLILRTMGMTGKVDRDMDSVGGCGHLSMYQYLRNAILVDLLPELLPPALSEGESPQAEDDLRALWGPTHSRTAEPLFD